MRHVMRFVLPFGLALALAACGDDGNSDPCKLAENANHPACIEGDYCAHPDFAETAGCVAVYCSKQEHFLESKCVTPLRKTIVEISQIGERTKLCADEDPEISEVILTEPLGLMQRLDSYCSSIIDPALQDEVTACRANVYKSSFSVAIGAPVSTACASCTVIEGACLYDACNDLCPFVASAPTSACLACVEEHEDACMADLLYCAFGENPCEGVECGNYACQEHSGFCKEECSSNADCHELAFCDTASSECKVVIILPL